MYLKAVTTLCVALMALVLSAPRAVHANCGSTFCSTNTNWEAQGEWSEPGFRLNSRYEYVKQDQLRTGSKKTSPAGEPDEHDELETINQNLLLGLDYSVDENWGIGVQLPFVKRKHSHLHNPDAAAAAVGALPELESWSFSAVGDARVVGRYQFPLGLKNTAGLRFGLKLPSGKRDEANGHGDVAERTLQPGTGSTDVIAGAYVNGVAGQERKLGWFAQAQWQHAVATKDEFRPGDEITVDLGMRYAYTESLHVLAQLNARHKRRDGGANAEAADSGGEFLFLSPGLGYFVSRDFQVYAFVQVPLYQSVNGVQLTARTGFVVGTSYRF